MSHAQLDLHNSYTDGLRQWYSRWPQGRRGMEVGSSSQGPRCLCTNGTKPDRTKTVFLLLQQGHSPDCAYAVATGAVLFYAEQAYIKAQLQQWPLAIADMDESRRLEQDFAPIDVRELGHAWEILSGLLHR
jgi:hypothetical protein